MNPKDDLENRLREQYHLISQWQEVERLPRDPADLARAKKAIAQQNPAFYNDLAAYAHLCKMTGQPLDEKIREAIILVGIDPANPPSPRAPYAATGGHAPAPASDPFITHPAFDPQQTPNPQGRNELAMQLDREGKDDRDALDLLHQDYWAQRIEPGIFVMGDDESDQKDEQPAFPYKITQPYALARFLVTNRQYAWFLEELLDQKRHAEAEQRKPHHWTSTLLYPPGSGSHPVRYVDWTDACAFAAWADAKLRRAGVLQRGEQVRLPTEPEWERAAAYPRVLRPGSSASVRRRYPWGNSVDLVEKTKRGIQANIREAGIGAPSVVGIFPHGAADCGAEDMAGNVREWCSTPYQRYPLPASLRTESIDTLSKEEYENKRWVVRGGSYYSEHMFARCASRFDRGWRLGRYYGSGVRLARLFSS